MSNKQFWYAVMRDSDDQDWGYGSHDHDEAVNMVQKYIPNGGYIAIIDEDGDPVCVGEIRF